MHRIQSILCILNKQEDVTLLDSWVLRYVWDTGVPGVWQQKLDISRIILYSSFLRNDRTCVLKVEEFSKRVNLKKKARAFLSQFPGSNKRLHSLRVASLPPELCKFDCLCVTDKISYFQDKTSYFQSLMDVQPLWHFDVYQQNVFCSGRNKAENHIPK